LQGEEVPEEFAGKRQLRGLGDFSGDACWTVFEVLTGQNSNFDEDDHMQGFAQSGPPECLLLHAGLGDHIHGLEFDPPLYN
jgi:hypothetical protein